MIESSRFSSGLEKWVFLFPKLWGTSLHRRDLSYSQWPGCPLMGEHFLRHLIHRWETMFYYLREALNSIKSSCCLDSTFLKVWVTFPHYSTPILSGVKPNHLDQKPTKWVEVVVMSPERFLEIHTLWDLSPFPIAYPANRTNLTLGGALE